MSRRLRLLRLVVYSVLAIGIAPLPVAHADGPHIALHAVAGPYEVTIFSAPDPLVAGPIDLTALVQNATTGALLTPVQITGELRASRAAAGAEPAAALPLTLSSASSSNRQLTGETVQVARPGQYHLRLRVQAPGRSPELVEGDLLIGTNQGRRDTVLWAVFLMAGVVLLFLANQSAKQRLRAHQARSR